jgi:predicted CDP-diglyceride synthetase/phosphatidate cytidylyltransferase
LQPDPPKVWPSARKPIAPQLTPFSPLAAASIGLVLAVCGFLGDVTLSASSAISD